MQYGEEKEYTSSCERSILKYCSVVELFKKRGIFPPLRRLIWAAGFGVWRLNLTFSPTCESRQIQAPCRGGECGLGSPLAGFSPNTELVFWLFLQSYLTSGPFSCWYFLLLKQRFFRYYSSPQVMAILCCVAQKAASAAWLLSINMRTFWNCCLGRFREDGSMNTGSVHWPVCARQCDGPTEYSTQYSRRTRENAWVY